VARFTFEQARECVIAQITAHRTPPAVDEVPLDEAAGRVLAEPVLADRDFPALARSLRDGFAVRAGDTPGRLHVIGEVRAGEVFNNALAPGEAVEIMTGAPVPTGADAIVMVEHARRESEFVQAPAAEPGQHISPCASEARAGDELVPCGRRLGYCEIVALASVGCAVVPVFKKPRAAILATGDELVEVAAAPLPHQIRNSNAHSLAVQVRAAGGVPEVLPTARDTHESTRAAIERGLEADLLLLSGGVSAGKYDIVEDVLASLGAEFHFERVLIQPGQPLVFGRVGGKFFFGLPGNPASTSVTFQVFARAALELLAGQQETALHLPLARLTADFRHKPGLTRFLPALLSADGAEVTPAPWHGSSDIPALARANAFLVADAARESWKAGDLIRVLLR
jgi:molybdopterin molybdotransferase